MRTLTKLLTGAAGVTALVTGAAPASAQYYPSPTLYAYPYDPGAVVGQIVNTVIGTAGPTWSADTHANLERCAAVVAQRINAGYAPFAFGAPPPYSPGQVVGIHSIERLPNGIRVRGVATDGRVNLYAPYAAAAQPDLRFRCDVDDGGYVMDVSLGPNTDYTYNWTPYTRGYYY